MSTERQKPREPKAESPASDFVRLLDYLKSSRGFDFSGYKLSSLIRRVQKRMQQVGIASYADYVDYLEVHPDEFLPLFNTVLINVTAFFRDPPAWQVLAYGLLFALAAAGREILRARVPNRAAAASARRFRARPDEISAS